MFITAFARARKRPCVTFLKKLSFYGELFAPRTTPKLEDHSLSAANDYLLNIFADILHIWRPYPPSATRGRAMPWGMVRI